MTFDERIADADPLVQFRAWWDEARATDEHWTDAMVLATVSPQGGPSARGDRLRYRRDATGWHLERLAP